LERTLYSWRHFYATQDLEHGVSTHMLSKQLGNSTAMIDKHYNQYSLTLNAALHSGRTTRKNAAKQDAKPKSPSAATLAFDMLKNGKLTEQQLIAALGVERDDTLMKILNG
jgi:hypothetical protein